MYSKNEDEIISSWNTEKYQNPLVTIRCMTYNHEKYIASAIEGFLSQKTTFPFVIYIHDDCSQDATAQIIRQYQDKFPHIIQATYESENQWSKKDGSLTRIVNSKIHTKYEAICEGDDYWIDEYKLEKQINYLEAHKGCSISITNGRVLNLKNGNFESIFRGKKEEEFGKENQIITLANCSALEFPPTASYVLRRECLEGIDEIPRCFTGDQRRRLFLMTKGYCYYFADETVVYRKSVPGSAMTRTKHQKRCELYQLSTGICEMLDAIDQISDYKFSDELWKIKVVHLKGIISNSRSLKVLKNQNCKKVFSSYSLIHKVKIIIKMMTPDFVYEILRKK